MKDNSPFPRSTTRLTACLCHSGLIAGPISIPPPSRMKSGPSPDPFIAPLHLQHLPLLPLSEPANRPPMTLPMSGPRLSALVPCSKGLSTGNLPLSICYEDHRGHRRRRAQSSMQKKPEGARAHVQTYPCARACLSAARLTLGDSGVTIDGPPLPHTSSMVG
ncbi:hypothetical protein NHX12_027123 [Muraenolepis orangiensis]|uniref:Uncharacterized protein n=1 Tax=Muraenolepis orangiensis TaxID=630683 RepID=A0A9Q0EGD3_9TELE|nr:hypothetical protein NHX12_027123 [Muraenolepis orangiensis]